MRKRHSGFGLIELMIAMVLGLLLVLGMTQVFLSARQTSLAQSASAQLQEDARYVLSKIAQEIVWLLAGEPHHRCACCVCDTRFMARHFKFWSAAHDQRRRRTSVRQA